MEELSREQAAILVSLRHRGFELVAFPMYSRYIGVRRGSWAALLARTENGRFRMFSQPGLLIEGNLSVLVRSEGRKWFVWKGRRVEATEELLSERRALASELSQLLSPA